MNRVTAHKLSGQFRVIASTGLWEVGEIISFDPPAPMGPLGRRSPRGDIIKYNRKLLKQQQRHK